MEINANVEDPLAKIVHELKRRNDEKLYILEKVWKINSIDFCFNKRKFDYALIRPCNVDYMTYRNFSLGKKVKTNVIIHEGCISSWYADKELKCISFNGPFEQFMVDANINKLAIPLIENWIFEHNWKSYTVRTIDLKKHEVLYDNVKHWLREQRRNSLI